MSVNFKTARTLLASALRTANTSGPVTTDPVAGHARLYLNVTVASGTGGLNVVVRGYDRITGNAVQITQGGAAVTTTGTYVYELGISPSAAFGSVKAAESRALPFQWDALVTHADSSNYTYSLSVEITR